MEYLHILHSALAAEVPTKTESRQWQTRLSSHGRIVRISDKCPRDPDSEYELLGKLSRLSVDSN
jgi:hypothetical protein